MTAGDLAWLKTREPLASVDARRFPKATPLEGVLRNDCRILRATPGEMVVRAGDYGGSAFFVIAGNVRVMLDPLDPDQLGRGRPTRLSRWQALRRWWTSSRVAEYRSPEQVNVDQGPRCGQTDQRPTIFLQDYAAAFDGRRTLQLGPGDLFGEMAAMYRTPHAATVVTETEATLIEMRWQGLRLLRHDAQFAQRLDDHFRKHWLVPYLRSVPLLRFIPEPNLRLLADAVIMRSFGRIEWHTDFRKQRQATVAQQIESEPLVVSEGQYPTELVIIRNGFARASVAHGAGHRTVAYLGPGQLACLEEVVHNVWRSGAAAAKPVQQSLRAVGFVDSLHLPIETFASQALPSIRRAELPAAVRSMDDGQVQRQARASDRRRRRRGPADVGRDLTAIRSDEEIDAQTGHRISHTGRMEFVVENRLFNGRQAMVIDLHRCTRCDDCVRACAATHDGNPRFQRTGPTHGRLQFAQACMHCEDPVCMLGCPTGAIHRDLTSGVVRIEEPICIGCRVCAHACPYDNIQMTEIRDAQGRTYVDADRGLPILKATKCDLCHQQPAGPACTAACPHDALVRIDLTHPGPLQQWLEER